MDGPISPVQLSTANIEASENFVRVMFDNLEKGKYYYAYISTLGPELFLVEVYEKDGEELELMIHFSKNEDGIWEEPPYGADERIQSFEAYNIDGDIKLYKPRENIGGLRRRKKATRKRVTRKRVTRKRATRKRVKHRK